MITLDSKFICVQQIKIIIKKKCKWLGKKKKIKTVINKSKS